MAMNQFWWEIILKNIGDKHDMWIQAKKARSISRYDSCCTRVMWWRSSDSGTRLHLHQLQVRQVWMTPCLCWSTRHLQHRGQHRQGQWQLRYNEELHKWWSSKPWSVERSTRKQWRRPGQPSHKLPSRRSLNQCCVHVGLYGAQPLLPHRRHRWLIPQ